MSMWVSARHHRAGLHLQEVISQFWTVFVPGPPLQVSLLSPGGKGGLNTGAAQSAFADVVVVAEAEPLVDDLAGQVQDRWVVE